MEMVNVRLQDAWLESPVQRSELILLHSGCFVHVMSKTQVQPLGLSPAFADDVASRPVVTLDCAVHLHWTHGYYQFIGEILPKILELVARGVVGSARQPQCKLLLREASYVRPLLTMLNLSTSTDVEWYDGPNLRYFVRDLWVQEFRTPPLLDLPAPDRLSTAPVASWHRLRQVCKEDKIATGTRTQKMTAANFCTFLCTYCFSHQTFAPPLPVDQRDLVVYVTRAADAGQRAVLGEALLRQALQRAVAEEGQNRLRLHVHEDFRGRSPPSIQEQIEIFRRARVVVGAHGGGLANVFWVGPGSSLVELPLLPAQRSVYAILCAAFDLDYWVVPQVGATQFGDFNITQAGADYVGQTVRAVLRRMLTNDTLAAGRVAAGGRAVEKAEEARPKSNASALAEPAAAEENHDCQQGQQVLAEARTDADYGRAMVLLHDCLQARAAERNRSLAAHLTYDEDRQLSLLLAQAVVHTSKFTASQLRWLLALGQALQQPSVLRRAALVAQGLQQPLVAVDALRASSVLCLRQPDMHSTLSANVDMLLNALPQLLSEEGGEGLGSDASANQRRIVIDQVFEQLLLPLLDGTAPKLQQQQYPQMWRLVEQYAGMTDAAYRSLRLTRLLRLADSVVPRHAEL